MSSSLTKPSSPTGSPAPNPNISQIPAPIANVGALAYVAESLKQAVDSLAGFRGNATDRAVTFNDLVNLGLASTTVVASATGTVSRGASGAQAVAVLISNASQTITTLAQVPLTLGTSSFDTGGFYPGSGSEFVIPSGVNMVRLSAGMQSSSLPTTGFVDLRFLINGTADAAAGSAIQRFPCNGTQPIINVTSGPIAVSAGQTIQAAVFTTTTIVAIAGNTTFFGIEKLG